MESIDFSKAPEGAKKYAIGSDVISCGFIICGIKEEILWFNDRDEFTWGACFNWLPCSSLTLSIQPIEIPKQASVTHV